jgi:hypothetical protein
MVGLFGAVRMRRGGLALPLVLFALLIGCSALAAVIVAADLTALSRGHRVAETRTGPLVAAVEKSLQEPRRIIPAPARSDGAPRYEDVPRPDALGNAEMHRRATLMMLFNGEQDWGDLLLRR